MNQVMEMEEFIEKSKGMLSGVLSNLGWTKSSICTKGMSKMVVCPLDESHVIPEKSVKKHINKCRLCNEQLLPKDFLPSSCFFYSSSSGVVPVLLDSDSYKRILNKNESLSVQQEQQTFSKSVQHGDDIGPNEVLFDEEENQREERTASLESEVFNEHDESESPYNKIKSVYRWKNVPPPYHRLRLDVLNSSEIKKWLVENLPDTQLLSSVAGADAQLVNYLWSCLNEASVAHPDGLVQQLQDLLTDKTRSFVLKLWKFLAVSILAANHGISKADCEKAKREAVLMKNNTKSIDHEAAPGGSSSHDGKGVADFVGRKDLTNEIPKPVDRVRSELTPQERLAIYDHVLQVSKAAKRQSAINLSELEKDLEKAESGENPDGAEQAKSHVEVLAEMRDYKRRRQSYRAKNVHITKRSATDVMRDLIETQMKTLQPEEEDMQHDESSVSEEKHRRDERKETNHKRDRHEERHRHREERRHGNSHSHHSDKHKHRQRSRDEDHDMERHRSRHRDRTRKESSKRERNEDQSYRKDIGYEKERDRDRKKGVLREEETAASPRRNEKEIEAIKKQERSRRGSRESGERSSSNEDGDDDRGDGNIRVGFFSR